ncbi:zinc ribbon domain-containing protein [Patescibacteria group bacterium]|nr:zinc ribbon domain-containing protein [Patescibacteria group bacterium]MBU1931987.1 zinc ribbon domain-containing protein [Patescibacteria group bacterium]
MRRLTLVLSSLWLVTLTGCKALQTIKDVIGAVEWALNAFLFVARYYLKVLKALKWVITYSLVNVPWLYDPSWSTPLYVLCWFGWLIFLTQPKWVDWCFDQAGKLAPYMRYIYSPKNIAPFLGWWPIILIYWIFGWWVIILSYGWSKWRFFRAIVTVSLINLVIHPDTGKLFIKWVLPQVEGGEFIGWVIHWVLAFAGWGIVGVWFFFRSKTWKEEWSESKDRANGNIALAIIYQLGRDFIGKWDGAVKCKAMVPVLDRHGNPKTKKDGTQKTKRCKNEIKKGERRCSQCGSESHRAPKKCPACGKDGMAHDAKHCTNCGAALQPTTPTTPTPQPTQTPQVTCPHCGSPVQSGWAACAQCGVVLSQQPAPQAQAPSTPTPAPQPAPTSRMERRKRFLGTVRRRRH